MQRSVLLSGSILGCILALVAPVLGQSPTSFTSIDAPGAGTGAHQGTIVKGIDAAGDVAGTYIDSLGAFHGFLRAADGTVTTFDIPGAATTAGQGTMVTAINSTGSIAGYFTLPAGQYFDREGFLRATDGTITTFTGLNGTSIVEVWGINTAGAVTGSDSWVGGGDTFVRSADGTGTNFVLSPLNNDGNMGVAINAAGAIAGRYVDYYDISHGFSLSADGTTLTTFDPPNVATTSTSHGNSGTLPTSIDTAGDIAGTFTDVNGARHGFVRTAAGVITTFDVPGAETGPCASSGMGVLICGTGGFAMDDAMDIVGAYVDGNTVSHGFLRSGSAGAFTTFDAPGAGTGAYEGTAAFAINAAGTIAGSYVDANSVIHGFVGTAPSTASTTTLTPAPTPNPSLYGEPVTLSATVSASGSTPANGETVAFLSGMTTLGSAPLSGGAASLTTTMLPVGADSITAVYAGDAKLAGSTSTAVSQSVSKASSSSTLTASPNPAVSGGSVTLTATISGQFGGTATGTVTFSNGSTSLGTGSLSGNSASLATTALPAGTDSVTAVYGGDGNFAGSTSNMVSVVVSAPATADFTVAASPASEAVNPGQSGTATVSVKPENGFSSAVSFSCSGLPTGASCSFSPQTVTPPTTTSTTLTIVTAATTAALHRNNNALFPTATLAAILCCFGLKKRRRLLMLLLLIVSAAGLGLVTGCSSAPVQVHPVTSTITITATSGSLQHTTTFTLTVN